MTRPVLPSLVRRLWPARAKDLPDTRLLARAILLEEIGPPRLIGSSIALIGLFVAGFVAWAAVAPLDEVAVAPGEILPEGFVQPVQHLEGGIVAQVLVRDGDTVAAGAPLLVLNDAAALAEAERLSARAATLTFQVDRLRAFAFGQPLAFSNRFPDHAAARDDQRNIYQTQMDLFRTQTGMAKDRVAALAAALEGQSARKAALAAQIALAADAVQVRRTLAQKGLSSRLALIEAERDLRRLEGDLATTTQEIAATAAQLSEARTGEEDTAARLREAAVTELGEVSAALAEVEEDLIRAEDRVRRLIVAAPVAGRVKGLAVSAPGAVIGAGQVVAEIVPEAGAPMAEVRVSPSDIGSVAPGKPALVKIATYDFARYGGIPGEVEQISATTFLDTEGRPYFRARVRLHKSYVGDAAQGRLVTPGMTLVADIKTGEKTLLAYLTRPVANTLATAFRER